MSFYDEYKAAAKASQEARRIMFSLECKMSTKDFYVSVSTENRGIFQVMGKRSQSDSRAMLTILGGEQVKLFRMGYPGFTNKELQPLIDHLNQLFFGNKK